MGRILLKVMLGIMLCGFVAVGGLLIYLSEAINVISEPPRAPVLAIPAHLNLDLPAYRGPHPRVAGRPTETFEFPIRLGEVGPVQPLFAGPMEYPFYCGENKITYEQPLVDNQDGFGVPVFNEVETEFGTMVPGEEIIGYSVNCLHPTRATYVYNREGTRDFFPLEDADNDIAMIEVDGKQVPFIIRLESGTINRYHYVIGALRGSEESIDKPNPDYWNGKLVYQFRGGVGIGKRQGKVRPSDILKRGFDQLARGYAMAYSSGTQTSIHYNMWLAEDTAARVKRQFVSLYGEPLYTIGIGGSGGAIQQYLIAQNHPGLLDGIIPLYSYPDMITQTIGTLDCEPLEYYFDVIDRADPRWRDATNRSLIQGMSANNEAQNRFTQVQALAQLLRGQLPNLTEGATECVKGWRGLTPLVNNPTFVHYANNYAPEVAAQTHWTHWDNLKYFYGVDDYGYANPTWDNIGVQYGLRALQKGELSPEDFLHLNANVGGWKPAHQLQPERLWLLAGHLFPVDLSFWSHHNMQHAEGMRPAARSAGSVNAMEAAYRSGHVFIGKVDVPILDVRHYLDKELDMHHATASFATRLRLMGGQGHADNQVIWMAHEDHNPINDAVALMDQWLANIRSNPDAGVLGNKPAAAVDRCTDAQGNIIAAGAGVWDGEWNGKASGACMEVYPRYRTSREVAGAPITGDVFKCHLQPVEQAIANGVYGPVDMDAYREDLKRIFPDGVCDYSRGDLARPTDLFAPSSRVAALPANPEMLARTEISSTEEVKDSKADSEASL